MRINVQCMECGRRFKTASMLPECPKCGGSDIEPAYTQPESKYTQLLRRLERKPQEAK